MEVRALVFPNTGVHVTYELNDDGSVYLSTVVTKGNFVQRYDNKYFSSVRKLEEWVRETYL